MPKAKEKYIKVHSPVWEAIVECRKAAVKGELENWCVGCPLSKDCILIVAEVTRVEKLWKKPEVIAIAR